MVGRIYGMGSTNIRNLGGAPVGLFYLGETKECCCFCLMLYRFSRVATNAILIVRTLRLFKSKRSNTFQFSLRWMPETSLGSCHPCVHYTL